MMFISVCTTETQQHRFHFSAIYRVESYLKTVWMETPDNQIHHVMLILSTWLSLESTKRYTYGWVCEDIFWKHKVTGKMALSLPLWVLPSHNSPDMERSKGKAMVLLSTPLFLLLVTASVSLLLLVCPSNVNQVPDVSRNPTDRQHHLGAIEAPGFMDWPAAGFSITPLCTWTLSDHLPCGI